MTLLPTQYKVLYTIYNVIQIFFTMIEKDKFHQMQG